MKYAYQKDVDTIYQKLTKDEQLELHSHIQQGDKQARGKVIHSCRPLVIDIANKFRINNKHIDLEDMIQEGNIALINAVEKWDVSKANITTVATWYVRNSLVDMITDAKYNIKQPYSLSRRAAEELRRIHKIDSNDIDYISEETGLSVKRVAKLLRAVPRNAKRSPYQSRVNVLSQISYRDEEDTTAPTKPCMADLVNLIDTNLAGDQKNIFCLWAGINSKKIGPKEIARSLGKTEKYVYDNIYSAKRILSKAAQEVSQHA